MRRVNIRRCRLCACEESFNNFLNIFDDNPEHDLEIKITKLLPIVVMPWDPMPHIICQECISKLNSFNDFYEASLKAERFLRTLQPSVPETEQENVEPGVRVVDSSTPRLPTEKRLSHDGSRTELQPTELREVLRPPDAQSSDPFANRRLESFIINHITTRDSVFTCRGCYRTFTKKSAALTHSCVIFQDCAVLESLRATENGRKSLPPLKIRLFSEKSGFFVCYLCQTQFERKTELVGHIKEHFVEDLQPGKKPRQTGKRRGRHKKEEEDEDDDDDDVDWKMGNKTKAPAKRRKRTSETPKKRGRKKTVETCENANWSHASCDKCGKTQESPKTLAKETVERMTQCSEVASSSEAQDGEAAVFPYPDEDSVEVVPINKPQAANALEDRTSIFETTGRPPSPVIGRVADVAAEETGERASDIEKDNEDADKSDEVTVLEVINNKTPTKFSSCVFCDKIFATRGALIAHQNRHLQNYNGALRQETEEADVFLCSVCAMTFTHRKTLLDHEQFHMVEEKAVKQGYQTAKSHGVLTITVSSREKNLGVKWT